MPHPFVVANRLVHGSYVSRQSALAYFGLIPEYVPMTTSVTTRRPGRWRTPLGDFDFRHIRAGLLRDYRLTDLGEGQRAFVATPEKALLDLVYLYPGSISPAYLHELRLQNLERLDLAQLHRLTEQIGSDRLKRMAGVVTEIARTEAEEYETI